MTATLAAAVLACATSPSGSHRREVAWLSIVGTPCPRCGERTCAQSVPGRARLDCLAPECGWGLKAVSDV